MTDPATRRPNVLLITCDQWRADSLSAAGHPVVRTPGSDALAAEGVMFARHFAGAAPCSPARACLYTGLYQMTNRVCRNGTPMDDRFTNIARQARRLGYDPTLFGYTDVAPDPRRYAAADPILQTYEGVLPGFTVRQALPEHQKQWLSWLSARGHTITGGFPDIHRPRSGQVETVSAEAPIYTAEETPAAFMAGEFIRWLGEQDSTRPWFAHVSFLSPHPPFIVPEPFNTMYHPDDGPDFARAGSVEQEASLHAYVAWELAKREKADFVPGHAGLVKDFSARQLRIIRAIYWGMVSEVDAQLGRMWRALKDRSQWQDTIVVLTSDHAEMLGDHHALGKGGFFESSYRIPLIIRDPRAASTAGSKVSHFTEAVDLFPTLLDLLGAPEIPYLDGASLAPFLRGGSVEGWRESAHWEFDFRSISGGKPERHFGLTSRQCNLAVHRTDRWKYVHFGGLPPLLFDLWEDPNELRNLAVDTAFAATRAEMAEGLLAWRAAHLDQGLALSELTEAGIAGHYAGQP